MSEKNIEKNKKKFTPDGKVKYFPGMTIVSSIVEASNEYKVISNIHKRFDEQNVSKNFAMLPPHSFHMTVFELYNDFERDEEKWSKKIGINSAVWVVNDFLKDAVASIEVPEYILMQPQQLTPNCLYIEPYDIKTKENLKRYRDAVSEATGIRFSDHDEYRFHISFAYSINPLSEEEEKECDVFCTALEKELKEQKLVFNIPFPEICYFTDMFAFLPYK